KVGTISEKVADGDEDPSDKITIADFRKMGKHGIKKFLSKDSRPTYCCTAAWFFKIIELALLIASMSLFRFGAQAVLMEQDKAFFVMGTTLAATVTTSCLLLTYMLGHSYTAQNTHLEILLSFLMFTLTMSSGHAAMDTYNTRNAKNLQIMANYGFAAGACAVAVSLVYLADGRLAVITFFKNRVRSIAAESETNSPYITFQYFKNLTCILKFIQISMAITAMCLFRFGAKAQLLEGDRAFLFVGALVASITITSCLLLANLLGAFTILRKTHVEIVVNLVLFGLLLPAGCVAIMYYTPSNKEVFMKERAWQQVADLGLGSGISALVGSLAYLLDMAMALNQYFGTRDIVNRKPLTLMN
ncbi:unnamed protein product, partial [Meganyctiphanes norvegica]